MNLFNLVTFFSNLTADLVYEPEPIDVLTDNPLIFVGIAGACICLIGVIALVIVLLMKKSSKK